ncbi:hypothetical protein AYO40_01285 [Planctomycetaceae bacterium SCGC AG-212-D15]|nr:hypothetical protein AYO40_01285 [Planctomycetaceae bacterium SCGC AG-212-D15]
MNIDPLLEVFLEEAGERLADAEQALLLLEKAPGDEQLLNRIFRCAHTLKSNGAMLGFQDIARFTHTLEDLLDLLRKKRREVTPAVIDVLLASQDILRTLLAHARSGAGPSEEETRFFESVRDKIRSLLDDDSATRSAAVGSAPGEIVSATELAATAAVAILEDHCDAVEADLAHATADHDGFRRRSSDLEEAYSIRVPIDRVDRLINLVGELVISQSIVSETVAHFTPDKLAALQDAVTQMDRHARELHERLMSVRMVPFKHLFGRFPRLVRDLALATGKEIDLRIAGEETEIDKTVIERISDPLTHLVRNAVDHGIEVPEYRLSRGKARAGTIDLQAYQQGGNIYVEVADDGGGIDHERVRARAVQQGMIRPDEILGEDETLELLFRPGFSTAERISEISGRGVGLDIVRQNLEALGGSVAIQSARGVGARFRIRLPLTLAIMDGQAIRVGDQAFLLPLVVIVESIRPPVGSLHSVTGVGEVVLVRGLTLPLIRLHRIFGIPTQIHDPTDGLVVIVEHEGRKFALLVDEVLGQQQVVIKSLDTNFRKVDGIAGATILGDGRVALILDALGIIHLGHRAAQEAVGWSSEENEEMETSPPLIVGRSALGARER